MMKHLDSPMRELVGLKAGVDVFQAASAFFFVGPCGEKNPAIEVTLNPSQTTPAG
jgi:hypothetical protein